MSINIFTSCDISQRGAQQLKGVKGDEGLYLPNCQTNFVIALHALSLLFCDFINTKAYHLGRCETSSLSTKELHVSCMLFSVHLLESLCPPFVLCSSHIQNNSRRACRVVLLYQVPVTKWHVRERSFNQNESRLTFSCRTCSFISEFYASYASYTYFSTNSC